ncbi:MAG: hypothetical protein O3A00_25550 [Planctomycetota bacterium]|nr:hypothetical protein [Planctomycetota bacterium]
MKDEQEQAPDNPVADGIEVIPATESQHNTDDSLRGNRRESRMH